MDDEAIVIKTKDQLQAQRLSLQIEKQQTSTTSAGLSPDPPASPELQLKRRMSIMIDPTGISKGKNKPVYQHKKAFLYALVASVMLGICNLSMGIASIKHSFKGIYPSFVSMILLWLIYHTILHIDSKNNPRLSSYRDDITDKLSL